MCVFCENRQALMLSEDEARLSGMRDDMLESIKTMLYTGSKTDAHNALHLFIRDVLPDCDIVQTGRAFILSAMLCDLDEDVAASLARVGNMMGISQESLDEIRASMEAIRAVTGATD